MITLEEKLDQANLLNAKLLYQNKALENDSLNERQKENIVEALNTKDLATSIKGNLFYSLEQKLPINVEDIKDNYVDISYRYIPYIQFFDLI